MIETKFEHMQLLIKEEVQHAKQLDAIHEQQERDKVQAKRKKWLILLARAGPAIGWAIDRILIR